jgi:PAS domain S-box-containing protein
MAGRSMVVSLVQDITERREAELARRKSESRLSAMIAYSPLGIAFVDGEGRLFECNSALTEMVGYPRTQLLGKSFEGFTHPDDLKREWELIRKTWEGVEMSYRMEKRYIHRDGRTFWVDVLSTVLPDHQGRPECAFAFVQDITERRRAAEALKESEERYRMLFNMSNDAIFFYGIDPENGRPGWFMEANETACRWLGYTREEMLSRGPMEITVPGYPYNAEAFRADLLLRRRACFEMGIAGRDGRVIEVEANARAFDYGKILAVLVVSRNITERKQLEATLRRARDSAEAANQAKGNFLSNMSHELRTPLNAILGYAQILQGQESLDARQREAVRVIGASGEHLLTLINDILDISKIEAGKMGLSADVFNLRHLLADLVDLIRLRARERGIHLDFSAEPEVPDYVTGDEKRLRQILLNLLSNAVKFTVEGEVALRVTRAGDGVGFSVIDTGIGIPEDHREAVFKPFEQILGGNGISDGTGLGLSISRELVTLMGGTLKLASREGEGTTFSFGLPLRPASGDGLEVRPPDGPGEAVGYAGRRRRVLVADDVADNRDILTGLLTPLGFGVTAVEGGAAALHAAGAEPPDIVFMDLVMPGMDGYEAIARLRKLAGGETAAILAVSADASPAARQGAMAAGADGFVAKPVFRPDLLREMAAVAGLEWLREPRDEAPAEAEKSPLIPPPADEIERLHQAARIGDLGGIRAAAEGLMARSPEYSAFCERVLVHARRFEIGRLKALIAQYRENLT